VLLYSWVSSVALCRATRNAAIGPRSRFLEAPRSSSGLLVERSVASGWRTLALCYNRPLALLGEALPEQVEVDTWLGFLRRWRCAEALGLILEFPALDDKAFGEKLETKIEARFPVGDQRRSRRSALRYDPGRRGAGPRCARFRVSAGLPRCGWRFRLDRRSGAAFERIAATRAGGLCDVSSVGELPHAARHRARVGGSGASGDDLPQPARRHGFAHAADDAGGRGFSDFG